MSKLLLYNQILEELNFPKSVSALAKKLDLRRDYLTGYLNCLVDLGLAEVKPIGNANVYFVALRGQPFASSLVNKETLELPKKIKF